MEAFSAAAVYATYGLSWWVGHENHELAVAQMFDALFDDGRESGPVRGIARVQAPPSGSLNYTPRSGCA
jgi:hypothetical protein